MADAYGYHLADHGHDEGPAQAPSTGQTRSYSTRRAQSFEDKRNHESISAYATDQKPKPVKFIYSHARLPLRVHINKHDTTNSIITSVKTFFGIHEGLGVSFENEQGFNIIPQYENVHPDTDIQVRLTQDIQPLAQPNLQYHTEMASPAKSLASAPWMNFPTSIHGSRPASTNARGGDVSPDPSRKYRMGSVKASKNVRSYDADGLSDSDGGSVSVTSSRRDVLVSADISVENIVEGNRRAGAKFESSELPLFKPPHIPMTASASSASPQKRFNPNVASPLPPLGHRNVSYGSQVFPSPVSYGHSDKASNLSNSGYGYAREPFARTSGGYQTSRLSGGSHTNNLPTPALTLASGISDEDVAIQLMKLGDPNNAPLPRPSASNADDTLSGKAEHASSGEYSEEERDDAPELPRHPTQAGPARKKLKALNTAIPSGGTYSSGEEYEDFRDGSFNGNSDEIAPHVGSKKFKHDGVKSAKSRSASNSGRQFPKMPPSKSKPDSAPGAVIPPSPYSASGAQSKGAPSQLGSDEEDLSAKPRCQRCRKSKKGCDRERPCGRCKDAGIGIEGCISEDEGNGRKGRFGRHMGVAVKKPSLDSINTYGFAYSPPAATESTSQVDAGKKRKR